MKIFWFSHKKSIYNEKKEIVPNISMVEMIDVTELNIFS